MNQSNLNIIILAANTSFNSSCPTEQEWAMMPILGKPMIYFLIDEWPKFLNINSSLSKNTHLNISNHDHPSAYLGVIINKQQVKLKESLLNLQLQIVVSVQEEPLDSADSIRLFFHRNPELVKNKYTFIVNSIIPTIKHTDLLHLLAELSGSKTDNIIFNIDKGICLLKTEFWDSEIHQIQKINESDNQVNTFFQLEKVAMILQKEKILSLMNNGVRFINSSSVVIETSVLVEKNVLIYPGVIIEGNSSIGENVIIEAGAVIKNSKIENKAVVRAYSYLENCTICANASVGPFARIRPESIIGEESKVGNFVEIKKSVLEKDVKVSHLSYIGDASIGSGTNVGCGFITCNYDGIRKHKTVIGKNCFIGSDCQAVAPVTFGDNTFIAAGSTITENIPSGAFAIARSKQTIKEDMAHRFLPSKKTPKKTDDPK